MLKSNKIAISGICAALAAVILIIMSYGRFVTVALSFAAAFIVAVPLIKDKSMIFYSLAAYAVSVFASFFFAPSILELAPYAILIAPYILGKIVLDKKEDISRMTNIILKYVILDIGIVLLVGLNMLILGEAFLQNQTTIIIVVAAAAILNAVLVFFDYLIGRMLLEFEKILGRLKI